MIFVTTNRIKHDIILGDRIHEIRAVKTHSDRGAGLSRRRFAASLYQNSEWPKPTLIESLVDAMPHRLVMK